ncbi:hypothetical protein [Nostoc phage Nsp-JY10]
MAERLSPQLRSPYDWSLDQPGSAYYIEPVSDTVPADLDPHLAHLADDRPQIRVVTLHGNADAFSEMRTRCNLIIGLAACAAIAVLCVATAVSTSMRIPEIERQLAMQARI